MNTFYKREMFIPPSFASKEWRKGSDWVGKASDHSTAKAEDEEATKYYQTLNDNLIYEILWITPKKIELKNK